MGWWPFGRKAGEDRSVDTLLAEANTASPTGAGFRLTVDDTFSLTGRGTVVTGRVESGTLTVGEEVRVVRAGVTVATTKVSGIEAFREVRERASVGDNVGVLVPGMTRDQVLRGDSLER
jgi:translation elongation factor EF-Tu-like GTPase